MRTAVSVGGKPALAVVLSDVTCLTYSIPQIKKAITVGKYGQATISKDFLLPGEDCVVVRRGPQSKRRRCDTVYKDSIDVESWTKLLECECNSILLFASNPQSYCLYF